MSYYLHEYYEYIIIYSYLKHDSRLANLYKKPCDDQTKSTYHRDICFKTVFRAISGYFIQIINKDCFKSANGLAANVLKTITEVAQQYAFQMPQWRQNSFFEYDPIWLSGDSVLFRDRLILLLRCIGHERTLKKQNY